MFMLGTASGHQSDPWPRHRHWTLAATVVAVVVLLVPAIVWAHPARLPWGQDDGADTPVTGPGQVIAQGIARLPRGEVAWTVRRLDVASGGTRVEAFPIGFVLADGATVALRDEADEVTAVLADGEAAFLPEGDSGSLASWGGETASLYEVALVSGEQASAGTTPGNVVGNPFAAPRGTAFEIELARETLSRDEEATIPAASSAAPVLFLLTAGSAQLAAPGGEPVALAAGQYALLLGEVEVSGASDEPAAFLVATIGESIGAASPDVDDNRAERRAARGERQQGQATAQGSNTASSDRRAQRQARRAQREARQAQRGAGGERGGAVQGGQTAPQGAGGSTGGAPVTGGVASEAPVGSPVPGLSEAVTVTPETSLPADTTVRADGTPSPALTIPADQAAAPDAGTPAADSLAPDDAAPAEGTVISEEEAIPAQDSVPAEEASAADESDEPVEEESVPAAEAPAEATLLVEEAPVEEPPPAEDG